MGQKYAAYDSTGAVFAFYDSEDSPVPRSVTATEITEEQWQTCISNPGWTVVNDALVAPAPPTTAQLATQARIESAQSMLSAGLAIVSASMPSLNGTYAVDQLSQMDIIAIETSLNAGKGFPGGASTLNYPDQSGGMHAFSETNFAAFAVVVRDYVYALKSVTAGALEALPASTVTIA